MSSVPGEQGVSEAASAPVSRRAKGHPCSLSFTDKPLEVWQVHDRSKAMLLVSDKSALRSNSDLSGFHG